MQGNGRSARHAFGRVLAGWPADALLAAGLLAWVLAYQAAAGQLGRGVVLVICCVAVVGCCVVARRSHPHLAAWTGAAALALASRGTIADLPGDTLIVLGFLLSYSLGAAADLRRSALALLALAAAAQVAVGLTTFNPFVLVVLVAGAAVGLVARSRRNLVGQLTARGAELEAERAMFAAEAVRYERARIARELHDIVAHSVSVMVVQAGAGQRLTATDPRMAAEAFDAISEVARQAETEIGRLVELLDHDAQQRGTDVVRLIGELVARAGAAGLAVSCRFVGAADGLPPQAADAAYRVVQEGLTNALKHAPGAPVEILISDADGQVEVTVQNGPAAGPPSGLELSGGGRGITGMRERVTACGGELLVGPADGGWRVLARLPRRPAQPDVPR